MGRFDGKTVMITGGARGQGRSHAISFAREGADIITCDIVHDVGSVPYPLARPEDLAETGRLVEELDRRCLTVKADVRQADEISAVVQAGLAEFGKIDILIANAGIVSFSPVWEINDDAWHEMIDINLSGVFKTVRAVVPHMIKRGTGRIIATSSMGGKTGNPNLGHYVASKWGVIGLVKTLALELAEKGITVNAVCPSNVSSPMIHNEAVYKLFRPDLEKPTTEDVSPVFAAGNRIPVPWVNASYVSRAMMYLASDDAMYITGSTLDVGCGWTALMP
jgi:SDR family mycofactocin-dependent oxidoreductase